MKLLAFLLLSLYILYVKSEACVEDKSDPDTYPCWRYCYKNNNTVCGNNGICHYNFKNRCEMNNRNCNNVEKNRPVFKFISKGPCVNSTLERCSAKHRPTTPKPAPASSKG